MEQKSDEPITMGCSYYTCGCHIQCPECKEFVCCRLHHDEHHTTHTLDRFKVTTMRCNYCMTEQPVGQTCINPKCEKQMSTYYCDICHLFTTLPPERMNIHCVKCGSCIEINTCDKDRFVHCDTCVVCITEPHEHFKYPLIGARCCYCGEKISNEINGEPFFQSLCGHWIHENCCKLNVVEDISKSEMPMCRICGGEVVEKDKLVSYLMYKLKEHLQNPTPDGSISIE